MLLVARMALSQVLRVLTHKCTVLKARYLQEAHRFLSQTLSHPEVKDFSSIFVLHICSRLRHLQYFWLKKFLGLEIMLRVWLCKCEPCLIRRFSKIVETGETALEASRFREKSCIRWGTSFALPLDEGREDFSGREHIFQENDWFSDVNSFYKGCWVLFTCQSTRYPSLRGLIGPEWSSRVLRLFLWWLDTGCR